MNRAKLAGRLLWPSAPWLAKLGRHGARAAKFRFGLVPQVITLVVLTVILVGSLISTVMVRQGQGTLREQIIANNLASADLAAELARDYVDGTQLSIRLFLHNPLIQQSVLSGRFSAVTAALQEFLQANKRLDGCSMFDAQGINRATGNMPASALGNYSGDRDWFQHVMATGKPHLGMPVISRGTGRPAVPYGVPVADPENQVKGILVCGISLAALNDTIAKFRPRSSASAALIDTRQGGIILSHSDRSRVFTPVGSRNKAVEQLLQGQRGTMETPGSSGQLNLTVYTRVPELPWGFLILQPSEAAFAPITEAARKNSMYIAGLLILSALVSGLLARRVTRPLARLRAAAGGLATGDSATRMNFTRQDEVGDVGRAFDQMAAALTERSAQLRAAHDELQSQYLQVQDANRLKSEFLANMSHELRTPLNAIIGFTQLMHDGRVGTISPDQQEYLNDILTSADHLLQLINDILDLAKVESGKLEFHAEPVQLAKLIAEVKSILEPLAANKRLTIAVAVAQEVEQIVIDPAKLKQILYNYLSNAIKFTPDEGQISVRARAEDTDHFRLEVEDTGIGIMADEAQKLFVAFQQLDSGAAKRHQGTGLGLALTKKIVEAQGGQVGVQSRRGSGSVFYAILPKGGAANEDLPAQSSASPVAVDAPNILIIEDNEVDLKWLSQCLTDADYRVDAARSGADGISRARARSYAAILLDLILPDTGGWDILHSIRSDGPNRDTPVIVITVVAEKGVARGFPIQDYLVKPVRPDALLKSLKGAGVMVRGGKRRILVVDDDVKILKLARVGLEANGYEVVCHSSGASALQDAGQAEYAAVVLDLLMPQMDGFEFLHRFRQIDQCRDTLVIVWTSKDLSDAEMERLKSAAQTVALKDRRGIEAVLKELRRHSMNSDGDRKHPQP